MNILNLLLRESSSHFETNQNILSYLTQNIERINRSGVMISIQVINDTNLNQFVGQGITSSPALIADGVIYGFTDIIKYLSTLEPKVKTQSKQAIKQQVVEEPSSFMDKVLDSLLEPDSEGGGNDTPSSVKLNRVDVEDPLDKNEISDMMKKFESRYKKNNSKFSPPKQQPATTTTSMAPKMKTPISESDDEAFIRQQMNHSF